MEVQYKIPLTITSIIEIEEEASGDAVAVISEDPAHKELMQRLELAVKTVIANHPDRKFVADGFEITTSTGEFRIE